MVCEQMQVCCYGDLLLNVFFLQTRSLYLSQDSIVSLIAFTQIWVRGQQPHAPRDEQCIDTHRGRYEDIGWLGVGVLPSSC